MAQDPVSFKQAQDTLERFLQKRLPSTDNIFTKGTSEKIKHTKDSDNAVRTDSKGNKFILKTVSLDLLSQDTGYLDKKLLDAEAVLAEILLSRLYKRVLLSRGPSNSAVRISEQDESENNLKFGLKSLMLENVTTLSDYSKPPQPGLQGSLNPEGVRDVCGIEKVFASCMFLGDIDPHAHNLLVSDSKGLVKIDHGKSLWHCFSDAREMMNSFASEFFDKKRHGYYSMPFELHIFVESLDQILFVSDYEIDSLVAAGIADIEYAGYDSVERFGHVAQTIKSQREMLKDVKTSAEILIKFEELGFDFSAYHHAVWQLHNPFGAMNKYIKYLTNLYCNDDPKLYEFKNVSKIIEIFNEYESHEDLKQTANNIISRIFENQDPVLYMFRDHTEEAIKYACRMSYMIEEKRPLNYAQEKGYIRCADDAPLWLYPQDESLAVAFALRHNTLIGGVSPAQYALDNELYISFHYEQYKAMDPLSYAVLSKNPYDREPIKMRQGSFKVSINDIKEFIAQDQDNTGSERVFTKEVDLAKWADTYHMEYKAEEGIVEALGEVT